MQSYKTPTKTVTMPDWAALYAEAVAGPIVLEDMTKHDVRAFNMWCRTYKGVNVRYVVLFNGYMQVAIGNPVNKPGRKPKPNEAIE